MRNRAEIMQEIIKVETYKDFFRRAIEAEICPKCGAELTHYKESGLVRYDSNYKTVYNCTECSFTHLQYKPKT